MRSIVAATDGSDPGRHAVDLAAELAEKFDADLTLVPCCRAPQDNARRKPYDRSGICHRVAALPALRLARGAWQLGPRRCWHVHRRQAEANEIMLRVLGEGLLDKAKQRAQEKGAERVETVLQENSSAADMILRDRQGKEGRHDRDRQPRARRPFRRTPGQRLAEGRLRRRSRRGDGEIVWGASDFRLGIEPDRNPVHIG